MLSTESINLYAFKDYKLLTIFGAGYLLQHFKRTTLKGPCLWLGGSVINTKETRLHFSDGVN